MLRERLLSSLSCLALCIGKNAIGDGINFERKEDLAGPIHYGIDGGPYLKEFIGDWDLELPCMSWDWAIAAEANNMNKKFTDHLRGRVSVEVVSSVVKI